MDARERRLAQNEALFREVNERVETIAHSHHLGPHAPYEFLCECANADCSFRIRTTLELYEHVRASPRRFIVLPGHNFPEVERVVEQHDAFWTVEKEGGAAAYVEALDRR